MRQLGPRYTWRRVGRTVHLGDRRDLSLDELSATSCLIARLHTLATEASVLTAEWWRNRGLAVLIAACDVCALMVRWWVLAGLEEGSSVSALGLGRPPGARMQVRQV